MAIASTPERRVVRLRNVSQEIFYAAWGVFMIAWTGAVVAAFVTSATSWKFWCAVAVLAWLAVEGIALARTDVSIPAGGDSFEVRNMWRRYRIRWSDVSGFGHGVFSGFITHGYRWQVVTVNLTDGRVIACQALTGKRKLPQFLEQLNAELARRRGAH